MVAYERLMQLPRARGGPRLQRRRDHHGPGQGPVLVLAGGSMHMSELVARLRVTPSTTSGLVEKLVEQGLVSRSDDPADRRQVIVSTTAQGLELLERFRELNSRQLREMLATISAPDLEIVERSLHILRDATAAGAPLPACHPSPPDRRRHRSRESPVSRLSQLAVSKRSVTLLLAAALFIAGISAWGSLKQELLPDIELPIITVVTAVPGRRLVRRRRAGDQAGRERHLRRPAARGPPVDLVQLDLAGHRPVLVRDRRQGGDRRPSRRASPRPACPRASIRRSRRSTSTPRRSWSRRSPRPRTAASTQVAEIARTEIVPGAVRHRRRRPGRT